LADWQQHTPQPGQQAERRPEASEHELAARIVEVTAGGGAVRVRVDGRGRIRTSPSSRRRSSSATPSCWPT